MDKIFSKSTHIQKIHRVNLSMRMLNHDYIPAMVDENLIKSKLLKESINKFIIDFEEKVEYSEDYINVIGKKFKDYFIEIFNKIDEENSNFILCSRKIFMDMIECNVLNPFSNASNLTNEIEYIDYVGKIFNIEIYCNKLWSLDNDYIIYGNKNDLIFDYECNFLEYMDKMDMSKIITCQLTHGFNQKNKLNKLFIIDKNSNRLSTIRDKKIDNLLEY